MTFSLTIVTFFIIKFCFVVQYQKEDFIGCFSRSDPDTFCMTKLSWFRIILYPVLSLSNMQQISEKSITHRKKNIPNVFNIHIKHAGGRDLHDTKHLVFFLNVRALSPVNATFDWHIHDEYLTSTREKLEMLP